MQRTEQASDLIYGGGPTVAISNRVEQQSRSSHGSVLLHGGGLHAPLRCWHGFHSRSDGGELVLLFIVVLFFLHVVVHLDAGVRGSLEEVEQEVLRLCKALDCAVNATWDWVVSARVSLGQVVCMAMTCLPPFSFQHIALEGSGRPLRQFHSCAPDRGGG